MTIGGTQSVLWGLRENNMETKEPWASPEAIISATMLKIGNLNIIKLNVTATFFQSSLATMINGDNKYNQA